MPLQESDLGADSGFFSHARGQFEQPFIRIKRHGSDWFYPEDIFNDLVSNRTGIRTIILEEEVFIWSGIQEGFAADSSQMQAHLTRIEDDQHLFDKCVEFSLLPVRNSDDWILSLRASNLSEDGDQSGARQILVDYYDQLRNLFSGVAITELALEERYPAQENYGLVCVQQLPSKQLPEKLTWADSLLDLKVQNQAMS